MLGLGLNKGVKRKMKYKNELNYTPSTWAEWTGKGAATVNNNYLVVENNTGSLNIRLATALKTSTKYGVLFSVRSNTRPESETSILASGDDEISNTSIKVTVGFSGNIKSIITTNASITNNSFYGWFGANSGKIEYGDMRVFELPTGSIIESDFTNLTADQLNAKYPM